MGMAVYNGKLYAGTLPGGRPLRQWRDEIRTPDDIWQKITEAADIPGTTSAPKLQPIAARIVMLQSGMRAPMGMKIKGPDLETIERVALQIEGLLKQVPTVQASAVIADRIWDDVDVTVITAAGVAVVGLVLAGAIVARALADRGVEPTAGHGTPVSPNLVGPPDDDAAEAGHLAADRTECLLLFVDGAAFALLGRRTQGAANRMAVLTQSDELRPDAGYGPGVRH